MLCRTVFFLLLLLSRGGAETLRITLESAPAYALRHNPALAAARLRIEEARGRLTQAGRLPNPSVDAELYRLTSGPESSVAVTFSQAFPVTARLRLEKLVSGELLAAAKAEVCDVERKLVADVESASVRLLALRGQRTLRREQLANSQELGDFTSRRLETGEASTLDSSQVAIESQQLATELLSLEVDYAAQIGELRTLLGMAGNETPVVEGELPPPAGRPAAAESPLRRADYAAAAHAAEAARQGIAVARAGRWADVGTGIGYTRTLSEDAPDGYQRDNYVGLKLSVPLPLWNRNEGSIQEATATARRLELEKAALARSIGTEAAAARDGVAALAEVIHSLDAELLPRAGELEKQMHTAHLEGQLAVVEVLRARARRLALERQRLEALRDYHLMRIRYRAATGAIHPIPVASRPSSVDRQASRPPSK